jgi:hypothetical protein
MRHGAVSLQENSTDNLPAKFLLANFLSTESSHPTSLNLNQTHKRVAPVMDAFAPRHTSEIAFATQKEKMRLRELLVAIRSERDSHSGD